MTEDDRDARCAKQMFYCGLGIIASLVLGPIVAILAMVLFR